MIEGSTFSIRLGLPGSGKSLGLVEEDLLPHLLDGQEVWCNFWINWKGPNLHFFTAEEFEELAPTLRNCVLVMDEIGQVMEPRAWEQESGNIRRFFQLHRHHHVDIYGTTQDISLVAKSAWIVVDEWILCEKIEAGIMEWIGKIIKKDFLRISYQQMTYQELKKLSYGWELGEGIEGDFKQVGGKRRIKWYQKEKLIHKELNEKKIELEHKFCEKCAGRQEGEKHCPKHKEEILKTIPSGMYDSDYDLEIKEQEIKWIPYKKTEVLKPYRGAISENQLKNRPKNT
ncbi:MAG: zonular occludens toxin domain-containing protein [Patescibacteria group bacterium]